MVEKMYGKEVFYEDVANELIPDAYDKAIPECEEDIMYSPKIEVMQIEAFEGFADDVAFEGGKGENYLLTIGSGAFIPGFKEQLVGVEI